MPIRISLLQLAIVCSSVGAADLKTITPTDIVNIQKVSDPQISPDGKLIAYVVETPVKAGDRRNPHIWLAKATGGKPDHPFIVSAYSDTEPRWSPSGVVLAFLSDRPNPMEDTVGSNFTFKLAGAENRDDVAAWAYKTESHKRDEQIWALSLDGGEAYPLTNIPGGVRSFKWSRDGEQIAFIRRDGDTKVEKERKDRKDDPVVVDRQNKYDRLWTYDLRTQSARLLTKADTNVDDFDWSPDGTKVIARLSPTSVLNDYWYVSKVVLLDIRSGDVSAILAEDAAPERVHWAESGNRVVYGEKTAKGIASLPVVEDIASRKKLTLGLNLKATIRSVEWGANGNSLMLQGVEGTRSFFARADASSGAIRNLAYVAADGYSFTTSRDGKVVAYLGQTASRPDDVWLYSEESGPVQLTDMNPQVAGWNVGKVQEISWISSKDKRKIFGVLVLPPDYRPGTPWKTVVHAHGGPFEAWQSGWLGTWYEWAQLLASNGYVVLAPNPRGSEGQGPDFQEANYQDWGGGDFQDVMDGVDLLIKQKIADPTRLGVGGWSYGGFMSAWTITHTDRFKAAIVGAAVTDLIGMSTTSDIVPNFLSEFFGSLFANRRLYEEHSPMTFIEACQTPVLILHGDADVRVPTFQGQEFYNALRFLKRDVEFVRYPREPHIFTEREHQTDMLQRILDFFHGHLR